MSNRKQKGCLIAAVAWCIIFLILGISYKYLVAPYFNLRLTEETGSTSRYEHELTVAIDSFSGYAVLRSPFLKDWLSERQIKLNLVDDGANYAERLDAMGDGTTQLAVFTIDSYLTAGIRAGTFPGSIVLVLDETQGGDALVAHESSFQSIQELNKDSTRLVLTPDSPSEFLARVILAHFNLPRLSEDWLEPKDGSSEVLKALKRSGAKDQKAFVLWQPQVAQALKEKGFHVLLDSSQLKGYIVDVLVAERSFLKENPDLVQTFTEGYFRALFHHQKSTDGMKDLVAEDAKRTSSEQLDSTLAQAVVEGIQWKNTIDNYAHFGLTDGNHTDTHPHIEDMISSIVEVLLKTKSISSEPLDGQYHTLFYDRVLATLKSAQFHPGQELSLIQGMQGNAESLTTSGDKKVQPLSDAQWQTLIPVGELQVRAIGFVRGSSNVSRSSEREILALAKRLKSFPNFYLKVIGQTRAEGNAAANQKLANERAGAVADLLKKNNLKDWRIRTEALPSKNQNGQFQSVIFQVGQLPY
ncbi:MAG: OmpA family protein [Verrucomicrobiota bacterium]|jgi:outer membrane protein OmpA-like peptidoglycan-associated protein|nr:OmpA family protein [Verrucomicrobiota bacterium]